MSEKKTTIKKSVNVVSVCAHNHMGPEEAGPPVLGYGQTGGKPCPGGRLQISTGLLSSGLFPWIATQEQDDKWKERNMFLYGSLYVCSGAKLISSGQF